MSVLILALAGASGQGSKNNVLIPQGREHFFYEPQAANPGPLGLTRLLTDEHLNTHRKDHEMKTTDKPKPVVRLQDGKIKIAIWKNTSEKGDFYSISPPTRTFKDQEGNYQDTTSLSGTQILQAQRLLGQAYDCIRKMQSKDYANSKPSGA